MGKWSAEFEGLPEYLMAAAARNAKQEQSIEAFKREWADLKVKAIKKRQRHRKNGENERPIEIRA